MLRRVSDYTQEHIKPALVCRDPNELYRLFSSLFSGNRGEGLLSIKCRWNDMRHVQIIRIHASSRAAAEVDKTRDEKGCEQVNKPVHLACFPPGDLQNRVGDESECEPICDAERERNGQNSQKRGNRDYGIRPWNLGYVSDHERSNDDQRRRGSGSRNRAHHRRYENRETE